MIGTRKFENHGRALETQQMTVQFKKLKTELRIGNPDDFYQELIDMHAGLSDEESQKVNAKLVLILANHIGDINVLREALECASLSASGH